MLFYGIVGDLFSFPFVFSLAHPIKIKYRLGEDSVQTTVSVIILSFDRERNIADIFHSNFFLRQVEALRILPRDVYRSETR